MSADISLIDFALHPPIGVLGPVLDVRGPYYEGSTKITTADGITPVSDTFGAWVWAYTIPPEWGHYVGYNDPLGLGVDMDEYTASWGQLVVLHQFSTGDLVATQTQRFTFIKELLLWDVSLPHEIGLWLAPGWQADIYWLRVLP